MSKLISIVTPCYNEESNVDELSNRIKTVMQELPYDYEHIFIDNHSNDSTVEKIRSLAAKDPHIKLIINARNFGHIRSPYYGLLQASGDAAILMASDLQDPPEMIPELIQKWEEGYKTVLTVKPDSEESKLLFHIRKLYYRFITRISEIQLIPNATGTGLFDCSVIKILKNINDPYPYFRGLLCEIGFSTATIPFKQPKRKRGISKNNFYTLYDMAMLGITSYSKVPLRMMTIMGFTMSLLSLVVTFVFLIVKLFFWNFFQFGLAPILVAIFFFAAIQMFSIGLLGEYIGTILTQVRKTPIVVESERVNFSNNEKKEK